MALKVLFDLYHHWFIQRITVAGHGVHSPLNVPASHHEDTIMISRPTPNHHIDIVAPPDGRPMRFELQPIMSLATEEVVGHEMLYRGTRLPWSEVDEHVIAHLALRDYGPARLFVNVSNGTFLTAPLSAFLDVAARNNVVFELSEAITHDQDYGKIVAKINEIGAHGVQFAIDDFGAGLDGLQRLYAVDEKAIVKIDSAFVKTCMNRRDARQTLSLLLRGWRSNGIESIAEGVESAPVLAFAQSMGFDMVQGWHIDELMNRSLWEVQGIGGPARLHALDMHMGK